MLIYHVSRIERSRTRRWMRAAIGRGRRVLYQHTGAAGPVAAGLAQFLGPDALPSGDVRLVDAAAVHGETGGQPAALREWHQDQLALSRAEGYTGLAVTRDGAALRVIAPEPGAGLAHERHLSELAAGAPVAVLCRYHEDGETEADLDGLLRVHTPGIEDVLFTAHHYSDRLVLTGEIDGSNAYRFAAVLATALSAGVRVVDFAGVAFLAAAGVHTLAAVAAPLGPRGEHLCLSDTSPGVQQVLHLSGLLVSSPVLLARGERFPER